MAQVKIILDDGEVEEAVVEDLAKALSGHREVLVENQRYDDPVLNDLVDSLDDQYRQVFKDLMSDVLNILRD